MATRRADPPPPEPTESHTGDGGEWGGAARGRGDRPPPAFAAGSDRAYRFFPARHTSRRLRREPVNSMQREDERAEAVASYAGAGPGETEERRARDTRMTRPPARRSRSPGAAEAGADGRKATARGARAVFRPSARLRVTGRRVTAAAADSPSRAGPRTECESRGIDVLRGVKAAL